ncbi:Neuropeptide CCHamide-1 receptor [Holothuria leucospilota]|uniref:Neuropeptide CCHamide-1 receptor n=1 Tax=Holothuria leucospilota TaxID=206669 RepID=A0A9Q1BJE1_HOLLE|nr:Neuropeptide CCHamide-1 receptor [Holothuria leucospilota]
MANSTTANVTQGLNETGYQNCFDLKKNLIDSASKNYWLVAVLFTYFLVGFFGNGILALLFVKEKSLRDINNALITNLAVSDFMYVGLFVPILIFSEFYRYRPFGKKFCIISILANYTSQDVSTLSLTALSYFRFCAIVTPFRSRRKSRSKLIVTFCVLSWLIGAVFSIYPAWHCQEHPLRECFIWSRHNVNKFGNLKSFQKYFYIRFTLLYLTPLFIIAYFYGRVAYTLSEWQPPARCCITMSSLKVSESVQSNNQAASRSRKKLSIVVLIIVITFFVSWLPTYVYWLTGLDDSIFIAELNTIRKVFMFVPATTNPIILIVTSTSYRQGFLNICFCGGWKSTLTQGTSTFSSQLRTGLTLVTRRSGNHAQSSSTRSESTFAMKEEPEQI